MYQPQFIITNKILKIIGGIEGAREIIENAPLLPYWEKKFQDDAILRTTHYGTHIEGNELSLDQVKKILDGEEVVTGRDRDVQEIINYRALLDFLGEASEGQITEELIGKIHSVVMNKILPAINTGKYRQKEVVIRNSITGEVSFRPPRSLEVPWQMSDLLQFLNNEKETHAILKAGIVHYEFVRIHPFVDGNGRTGRALSLLILFREGYDIRRFFSLEEHFDRNPEEYYRALQSVEEKNGDLSEWLTYFATCLAQELVKIKEKIENISIDSKLKKKLGGPVMLNDRQLKIVEYVQRVGFIDNKIFQSLFPVVSEDTSLREVQDLVKKNILKKQGVTKGVKYVMNE